MMNIKPKKSINRFIAMSCEISLFFLILSSGLVYLAMNTLDIKSHSSARDFDRSIIIGQYKASHKNQDDRLELRPDGTYYSSKIKVNKSMTAKGKLKMTYEKIDHSDRWLFHYHDGKPTIIFENYIFNELPGFSCKKKGRFLVNAERTFSGKIRLYIQPGINYYYLK